MKSRIPKQFQGGGQDMQSMIHQAKKMQDQIATLQEDIEQRSFTATAGGGAVSVTVNGKKIIESIELKPEVVDPSDIEMLQDLIMSAVNEQDHRRCRSARSVLIWSNSAHFRWSFCLSNSPRCPVSA